MGPVKIKDIQTLLPLRSSHFDIKDAQWAENKDRCKISYHITLHSSKRGVLGDQNSIFFQNGQICMGWLKLTWRSFFAYMTFFLYDLSFLRYDWFRILFFRTLQKFEKKNYGGLRPFASPPSRGLDPQAPDASAITP